MMHSQKIILWGGLAFVCGTAWTLGAAIPPVFTLAVILGVVVVVILIVAYAAILITRQPAQTRVIERETPQEPTQPQKRRVASGTRYTVVNAPSARLPQAAHAIGADSRKQIEVKRKEAQRKEVKHG